MKSVFITALLASAAIAVPSQADAKSVTDVIVMRRVIASLRSHASPTPTETPVPAATPSWVTGDWAGRNTGCGSFDQTREVTCRLANLPVDPASCAGSAPDSRRTLSDYSTCAYSWEITGHGDWSSTCSTTATRDTASRCARQDGETADDTRCAAQPRPAPETAEVVTGCSFAWSMGGWSPYSSTCSASASRSRTAECRRSDGTAAVESKCDTRPATSETADVSSGCSYAWEYGAWQTPEGCGAVTRTRAAICRRSDGQDGGTNCDVATREPLTGSVTDARTCGYSWVAGDWGTWNSTCSATATRTRVETCVRSDGQSIDGSMCADKAHNALSDTAAVYSGCSYAASDWSAWTYASQCSESTSRSRTAQCRRSDGTPVDAQECTTRGISLTSTETGVANEAGCTYAWTTGVWGPYDSFCSQTATRSRTVQCQATYPGNTGAVVADAKCTGIRPSATDVPTTITSGCDVDINGGFETGTTAGWINSGPYFVAAPNSNIRHSGNYGGVVGRGPVARDLPYGQLGRHRLVVWLRTQADTNATASLLENGVAVNSVATGSSGGGNTWKPYTLDFTVRQGGAYQLRIQGSNGYDFYVDDVTFAALP